jgi:hypothetical protein
MAQMKTFFITLLFAVLSVTSFGQADIVQFKTSKPYNILHFIETASGQGIHSTTFRKYIDSVSGNHAAFRTLLTDFSTINLNYPYKLEELPANRQQYRTTYELIVIAAVQSPTLAAFRQRTIGIIPNSEHQKLFKLLAAGEAFYDKWVWAAYKSKTQNQVQALKKYQKHGNALFKLYRTFYNSSWADDIPFTVALYPIPGKKGSSTATPHANSLCVGVFADETEHNERIGVVLHEMCHVLYSEQASGFQHTLDSFFTSSTSEYSKLAYSYFDEALATALGNGYTYQYISNKPDTGAWYDNKYIDGFAHAIYPMVRHYLAGNKTLDADFVREAIRLFGETFPKATNDYAILFNNLFIYADVETAQERSSLKSTLQNYFQLSHSNMSTPILHEYSLESLQSAKEAQLIVIDRNHEKNMAKLKELFPAITGYLKDKTEQDYVLSFFDISKRPVVIINIGSLKKLGKALQQLVTQQYIDAGTPYLPIH